MSEKKIFNPNRGQHRKHSIRQKNRRRPWSILSDFSLQLFPPQKEQKANSMNSTNYYNRRSLSQAPLSTIFYAVPYKWGNKIELNRDIDWTLYF